ncbi:dTMP kinase [Pseudoalteromonas piscicida]|jgi:dTMP kinase|uniref:Thymidylate kinase n=1 Tax=Pseudoalteromonas maricaloris TaxID=184924 RepID=A0A8I2KP38_9GAMM|nr:MULTISPECIES: dTMP kinase [Pseudoalteromonas]KID33416.1 thymidylate kinase [Pseudoalteromonas flavipulchra NCIMB 2033 = ATCC BAA-314]MBD0781961.1 dTMP kinase [Pseudoalteromonas flavipulchra]MBE0373003.1 dTMP kinase [Pseudoalteromonas flavipulchra NCIMB 2033 = ATCC BAA-314]NLR20392.1 dTMP kinase [Pseudoalteromonas maricaloris]NSY32799.1 dTMP kinase [Pseudoalteromonas sp. JC28]
MKKGFMLVCDGSNGAGKTTVITGLEAHLKQRGIEVVMTREPGGTEISEKIREIILDPSTPEMADMTELMLFGAARAQHVREKIMPALEQGKVVISDRFDAATFSFQHYARGLDLATITTINQLALGGFRPDMNLILDLDPEEGLKRVKSRGEGLDRLEDEKQQFLQRAREGYLVQAKNDPERFTVIDASQSKAQVLEQSIELLDSLIATHLTVDGNE